MKRLMGKLQKYGWILGIWCILLVPLNLYYYFTEGHWYSLLLAVFVGVTGVFNLVVYWVCHIINKRLSKTLKSYENLIAGYLK